MDHLELHYVALEDSKEFQKQALITDGVHAEWTTFRHYIAKESKENISSQLNNFLTKLMTCSKQCSSICIPWPMFA